MTKVEGLWDRWHFIRYRDPAPHLRLRFYGPPIRLLAELLPRIRQHLELNLRQGTPWKLQVDTFEPELERYGGPLGFALAEEWFFEDSQQILVRLAGGMTLEERWRAGLRDTDAIWAALGLGLPSRKELAQASRDEFRKEFGDPGEGAAQIGKRFREFRKELESGFPLALESPLAPGLGGLARIRTPSSGADAGRVGQYRRKPGAHAPQPPPPRRPPGKRMGHHGISGPPLRILPGALPGRSLTAFRNGRPQASSGGCHICNQSNNWCPGMGRAMK